MRYLSLFSGIGGFDLALDDAGHSCIGYSEIDKYAIKTYKKNFGDDIRNFGDAKEIKTLNLPPFDLLVAGFPCQSFSIAGESRGFEDTRGTLFFEIARILEDKKPKHCLLENVKGLVGHDKGKTFQIILETLWKSGYQCDWGVVNSRYFGVPQNRSRVFVIGTLRGESRPEIFPLCGATGSVRQLQEINVGVVKKFGELRLYHEHSPCLLADASKSENTHVARCLDANMWKGADPRGFFEKKKRNLVGELGNLRRLTPLECERLQGFPDGWTEGVSNTQRYKQLGNAVTVNVVDAIVRKF
jgi:DNA (cytosine-5)-methyltransferase 1